MLSDPVFADRRRLGGESLKRAPRGFDPAHPMIEHLRRKDFVTVVDLEPVDACRSDFIEVVAETCRGAAPLVRYLTAALGLPF